MASDAEVAVFTDTNLGTHLAMAVSPDTTVGDFQSEAKIMLLLSAFIYAYKVCFPPSRGSLVHPYRSKDFRRFRWGMLIKLCCYRSWRSKCDGNHITNSLAQSTGQEAMISNDAADWNSSSMTKNPTNISLKAISTASTPSTDRAIQGLPEEQLRTNADNYFSSIQIGVSPPFMVRTPPKQSLFLSPADRTAGIPRDKFISSEVGKRIIIASNNIRISDKQRPVTPLSKFK